MSISVSEDNPGSSGLAYTNPGVHKGPGTRRPLSRCGAHSARWAPAMVAVAVGPAPWTQTSLFSASSCSLLDGNGLRRGKRLSSEPSARCVLRVPEREAFPVSLFPARVLSVCAVIQEAPRPLAGMLSSSVHLQLYPHVFIVAFCSDILKTGRILPLLSSRVASSQP